MANPIQQRSIVNRIPRWPRMVVGRIILGCTIVLPDDVVVDDGLRVNLFACNKSVIKYHPSCGWELCINLNSCSGCEWWCWARWAPQRTPSSSLTFDRMRTSARRSHFVASISGAFVIIVAVVVVIEDGH